MTLGEAAENHANSLEGIMVRLNRAERKNRIMRECLEQVHEILEIKGSSGILNAQWRVEKVLEGK